MALNSIRHSTVQNMCKHDEHVTKVHKEGSTVVSLMRLCGAVLRALVTSNTALLANVEPNGRASCWDHFIIAGCFCVYSNPESFEYVRESVEKTLLSNLEQEDRLPFQGLPIVIMFIADPALEEKKMMGLREEGQSLADR